MGCPALLHHDIDDDATDETHAHRSVVWVRHTRRGTLVTQSPRLIESLELLERVAGSTCNVLVTGESGTGKELAVAVLHEASPRKEAPLVAVNCGAIPENLVESELFGHARGAFTGALAARRGLVASAEGGTLFLDEVGELPLSMQVKLLRLLQQREYTPLGESRPIKCDVRIVAATNRDLRAEVEAGRFREDLYYRLDVIHVQLPALRERPEDVPLLAQRFLRTYAVRSGRADVTGFAPGVLEHLANEAWPGNVRALENAVERAVLLSPGPIVQHDAFPTRPKRVDVAPVSNVVPIVPVVTDTIDLRAAVAAFEDKLIAQALERSGGNKQGAAVLLGLKRTTLVEMMKRKGLMA